MTHTIVRCRACQAEIVFLPAGQFDRKMPVDAAGVKDDDVRFDHKRHVSHFATCPQATKFRKPRKPL